MDEPITREEEEEEEEGEATGLAEAALAILEITLGLASERYLDEPSQATAADLHLLKQAGSALDAFADRALLPLLRAISASVPNLGGALVALAMDKRDLMPFGDVAEQLHATEMAHALLRELLTSVHFRRAFEGHLLETAATSENGLISPKAAAVVENIEALTSDSQLEPLLGSLAIRLRELTMDPSTAARHRGELALERRIENQNAALYALWQYATELPSDHEFLQSIGLLPAPARGEEFYRTALTATIRSAWLESMASSVFALDIKKFEQASSDIADSLGFGATDTLAKAIHLLVAPHGQPLAAHCEGPTLVSFAYTEAVNNLPNFLTRLFEEFPEAREAFVAIVRDGLAKNAIVETPLFLRESSAVGRVPIAEVVTLASRTGIGIGRTLQELAPRGRPPASL